MLSCSAGKVIVMVGELVAEVCHRGMVWSRCAGHLRAGELAEFGIDEREQFLPGAGIAVPDCFEEACDVAHGDIATQCLRLFS